MNDEFDHPESEPIGDSASQKEDSSPEALRVDPAELKNPVVKIPEPKSPELKAAAPKAEDEDIDESRRKFLVRLSVGLGSIGAALVIVPAAALILNIHHAPNVWRNVGSVDSFEIGTTVAVDYEDSSPVPWSGVTARSASWLRRVSDQEFVAFSMNCTHMGCPVRWLPTAGLFMCPCHGGVFYADGDVASGPPPKPLVRYPTRIVNGQVQILASPVPITT